MNGSLLKQRMCRTLIVDTSVLMYIVEKRLNPIEVLFSSDDVVVCRVAIPDVVEKELLKLSQEKASRRGRVAASALLLLRELISRNPSLFEYVRVGSMRVDVDSTIIQEAKEKNMVIATADKKMKELAEKQGVGVLFLRGAKGKLI